MEPVIPDKSGNKAKLNVVVRFRLPAWKKKKLERLARAKFTDLSKLSRGLLNEWADEQERQIAASQSATDREACAS